MSDISEEIRLAAIAAKSSALYKSKMISSK